LIDYTGPYSRELNVAIETAIAAGAAVRALYDAATAATYIKGDGSPVTDADLASDRIVRERIGAAFPDDALLTEEGIDDAARLSNRRVWIVDPIDGTQQFIDRTGEFDVVIALAVDGEPVVTAINQPATDQTLIAVKGQGAWVRVGAETTPFRFDARRADPIRLFTSVYFGAPEALPRLEAMCTEIGATGPGVSRWGVTPRECFPTGRYDALIGLYVPYRDEIAWEWDFAGPDLFVREAGGKFTDLHNRNFTYNKPDARNHGGLLMTRDPETHARILAAIRDEDRI